MKKNSVKILLVALLGVAIFLILKFDVLQYFELESIKLQKQGFDSFYQENPILTIAIYFGIYIIITTFSIPGATVMTLLGGALFGFVAGTILVSFASTIGATLAFLATRFIIGNSVQEKYGPRIEAINDGIRKEGAFYLFALRLVPVFPFFLINILLGLTPIKTTVYFVTSQIAMLPSTMAYVYAGTQLSKVESLSDILNPQLILAFTILGLLPLIAKKIVNFLKTRKLYSKFKKPKTYDYNTIVIGGGSGGLVAAYLSAALKAKVALIEADKMGGDCLNTGCVPSKAIIHLSKTVPQGVDFVQIMRRVKEKVQKIAPHDSEDRYKSLGVDVINERGHIVDPFRVKAGDRLLTTKNIIIATGAKSAIPKIPGLDKVSYLTNDNIWELSEQPKELLVIGGGPIGCELAQSFQRLGTKVTIIQSQPYIMNREDEEFSQFIREKFEHQGMSVLTEYRAKEFGNDGKNYVICSYNDQDIKIYFDKVLIALGRSANIKGLGIEELGIELRKNKTIAADKFMRTNYPNIYVCGDITGPYQFTHTASYQAGYAALNALFGPFWGFKINYNVVPWATYTDPEVARVGLNEKEAKEQGIKYEVSEYSFEELDRAITDEVNYGKIKVLTKPGSDKILGVTLMSSQAGELMSEFVLAMNNNLGLNKILNSIHIYPTLSEANKYVAGVWKKAHAPKAGLRFLEKFNEMRRK